MGNSDQLQDQPFKRAAKASVHHSMVSEHFEGDFPVFINRWEEGFDLREHNHAYLEIVYVTSGEGYHYIDDRVEKTGKGCLYILPVGTSHIFRPSGTSSKNKLVVYNLCVRPEFAGEMNTWLSRYGNGGEPLFIFNGEPGSYIAAEDRGIELGELFEHLYWEYTDKRWGFQASIFAGLLDLSVRIARLVRQKPLSSGCSHLGRMCLAEWSNLLDYINLHIAEPLTVVQLAIEAGMSRRHFIRLFRQQAGMNFSDYLQHKRVELACHLLIETDHKMAHISKSVGYQDTAHFREVFHKIMGLSPSEYRKNCK